MSSTVTGPILTTPTPTMSSQSSNYSLTVEAKKEEVTLPFLSEKDRALFDSLKEAGVLQFQASSYQFSVVFPEGTIEQQFKHINAETSLTADQRKEYITHQCTPGKDRYDNVFPYDSNRFLLPEREYINASCIATSHILTQGPLEETVNDFWTMVEKSQAACIVMLTQTHDEKGYEKCHEYWPDYSLKVGKKFWIYMGDDRSHELPFYFEGKLIPLEKKTYYSLRKISLEIKEEDRDVHQLHVTNWEDQQPYSPYDIRTLLAHLQELESKEAPTIIHCSAGIGRAGTFLICDIFFKVYQYCKRNNMGVTFDILNLFKFLRLPPHGREGIVQTSSQYDVIVRFINILIKEGLPSPSVPDSAIKV